MFTAKRQAAKTAATKASATTTGTTTSTKNAFLQGGLKKAAETRSGNDALKYSTSGDDFVDQFTKLGEYKAPRSYADIERDCATLWAKNPFLSVCFILYARIVTRIIDLFDGSKTEGVQRGAGLKHEAVVRMVWLHINHKETFWKNIGLFISAGSWKDVFVMLSYDLQYNEWDKRLLDWDQFKGLIAAGLENPRTANLVKKYLPQIKANSQCKTLESQINNTIAKWLCSQIFGVKESDLTGRTYKQYRQLKTSGTAHSWQQLISKGKMLEVNFDTVHGRALAQMVSGKFIQNHKLEDQYNKWIDSRPIVKFTGYVHELFKPSKLPKRPFQVATLNSQFMGLVETAKLGIKESTSLIIVRDTSGSMRSSSWGVPDMSSEAIAKALSLFFSYMLPAGAFANSWIEFSDTARIREYKGSTPWEKWTNEGMGYGGGTNFQSVIDLFCSMKKKGIPESEFPTGIVCISDGEFNPAMCGKTNVAEAHRKLKQYFTPEYVSKFQIILWNIPNTFYGANSGAKFETFGEVENVMYFGGYDASVLAFLTGIKSKEGEQEKPAPKTPKELFEAAMKQEILEKVEI